MAVSLNNTESPNINPGGCIKVLVIIKTNNIPLDQNLTINLTARSGRTDTANGNVEDTGQIIKFYGESSGFYKSE